MGRRSAQGAALVQAFADKHHMPIRTARSHRQRGSAEWQAFLEASADKVEVVVRHEVAMDMVEMAKANASAAPEVLEKARTAEAEAWASFQGCVSQKRIAMHRRDPNQMAAWIKAEAEAVKLHSVCVANREKVEQRLGLLIPAGEVARLRAEFVDPVREVLRSAPAEIGPKANPMDPPLAIQAIEDWLLNRFTPAMAALEAELPTMNPPSDPIVSMGATDSQPGTGGESGSHANAEAERP